MFVNRMCNGGWLMGKFDRGEELRGSFVNGCPVAGVLG